MVSQQLKGSRPLFAVLLEHIAEEFLNILIQLEFLKWHQFTDFLITVVADLKSEVMTLVYQENRSDCDRADRLCTPPSSVVIAIAEFTVHKGV